jgi:hypothetical protein
MEVFARLVDFDLEKPIFRNAVRQIIPGGERRSVFLIVTEFFVHVFLPKTPQSDKDITLAAKYALCDITKLDALDEVTFRITIGREIVTIVVETPCTILTDIYYNLRYIQLSTSLPQIDTSLASNAPIDLFLAVQRRYRAKLAWQGTFAAPDVVQSIERFLKRQPRIIDLGIIEDLGLNVPIFLDAMAIHPHITTVLVPARPQSRFYETLLHYFQFPPTVITTIGIVDCVEEEFYKFMSRMSKLPTMSLTTISFIGLDIDRITIEKLASFLNNGRYKLSLNFVKCDIQQCEERLNGLMEQSKTLVGVHMTTVWLADSVSVINAMLRLQCISLRGCGVKADEILSMLSRAYSLKVETLDLSKNTCGEQFKTTLMLPATLSKLIMDEVRWNYNNLITLFKLVCNAGQPMTFSCAKVQITDRHWSRFFQAIENCQAPQLHALIWNDNPVHTKLCQLLLKAPILKVLCIAGSRVLSEASLQKVLENHRALYIVDMHGTALNHYGPAIRGYFTAMKKSKSIKRLDVSHNKMGPQAFSRLVDLISTNPKIRQLLCDDNDLPNFAAFEPLVAAIQNREHAIYVRFPEEDFAVFSRNENIPESRVASIKAIFRPPEAPVHGPGHEEWLRLMFQQYPESSDIEDARAPIPKPEVEPPLSLDRSDTPIEPSTPTRDVRTPDQAAGIARAATHDGVMAKASVPSSPSHPGERANASRSPGPEPPSHISFTTPANIQMDFVDVPPIQNAQVTAHYNSIYSIHNLSQRLRSLI